MTIFPFIDGVVANDVPEEQLPRYTELAWDFNRNDFIVQDGRYVEVYENEAVKVWIYKAILTPRYRHLIYSWNYGSELEQLIGKTHELENLTSEVRRYLEDCLLINPYIKSIEDVVVSQTKEIVEISFTAFTIYGKVEIYV